MAVLQPNSNYVNQLFMGEVLNTFRQRRFFGGMIGAKDPSAPDSPDLGFFIKNVGRNVRGRGDTVQVDKIGSMIARAVPIGTDKTLTGAAPSFSKTTVQCNQWYVVDFAIDDATEQFMRPEYRAGLVKESVAALAEKFEDSVLATGATFTSFVAGAGTQLNRYEMDRAVSKLVAGGVPIDQLMAVLTPYQVMTLKAQAEAQLIGGDIAGKQAGNYMLAYNPSGVKIIQSERLVISGGVSKGFMLGQDAIMMVLGWQPRIKNFDEPLQNRIVIDLLWGITTLRSESGLLLNYDDTNNLVAL